MAIKQEFLNLLVHPVYKTTLSYDSAQDVLKDGSHPETFNIKSNVPILLTQELDSSLANTDRHKQAGTEFQYKEHYQNDAVAYDYTEEAENPVEREEVRRLRQTIVSKIPGNINWVLDVGCGGGWLANEMQKRNQKLISMDISDINPIRALKNYPYEGHSALVADVFEMPVKENSIDCIIASEIIEHVPDPKKFLDALYKVLKPGGKIIVTTPYNEFIRTTLCIHCNQLTPLNAHLHSFTEKSISKYLPAGAKAKMTIFNSKLLVKTHLQKVFDFIPLKIWQPVDQLANTLTAKKAYRLMVELYK
jgi:2-polyprenyl-3-methyl-5-hydroxy-6-metoxy-1,4-benzoquinol methylase/uncharacterized protein YbaR (Trm112 family)